MRKNQIRRIVEQVVGDRRAVCILAFGRGGKVLAVSRKDDPTAFGLPGGKVDPGEDDETAAKRELAEETGLTAVNMKPVFVGKDGPFTVTTFLAKLRGDISTDEAGVVKYVDPSVLMVGPFAKYNTELFQTVKQMGIVAESSASAKKKKDEKSAEQNPLDDPDNPNVPKGGRWGLVGAGQTPEMFRTRTGVPGLNTSPNKKITPAEAQKAAERINQVEPDEVIGYSKGAALFNSAVATGKMKHKPAVTYMAPSSYRKWGSAPVPKAPPGSKVTIGDKDTLVPMKQAAKNAVDADTPMYVLPGYGHVGIMYSKGDVTPGGFEVDPEEILKDPEMPDWGGGTAPDGKGGETIKKQSERVKQHVKEVRELLESLKNEETYHRMSDRQLMGLRAKKSKEIKRIVREDASAFRQDRISRLYKEMEEITTEQRFRKAVSI